MAQFSVAENGQIINEDIRRIAQIIHDYDSDLELAWVPPEQRELNEQHPFAVIHNNPRTGRRDVVFRLRTEEVDHRVLKRLWENDSKNGSVLNAIEAEEAARRAVEMQKMMDDEAERLELATWMIKAPVGARHNGQRLT